MLCPILIQLNVYLCVPPWIDTHILLYNTMQSNYKEIQLEFCVLTCRIVYVTLNEDRELQSDGYSIILFK